ncbi:MAG: glycosyltransferase family 4 protein [Nanoarchaeota archaeon]
MNKIKVIQIAHASHAVWLTGQKTLKEFIEDDWFSRTSKQIKKFYPEIEIECWSPEKPYKKEQEFFDSGVRYRQFPTTFSPMYGLDFSIMMLKALKKEIKKSEEYGYKLIIHLHEYHNLHGLLITTLFKNQKIIAQHHGGSWPMKHVREVKRYKLAFPAFFFGQLWENRVLKNIKIFYALSPQEIEYLHKVAPTSEVRFQTMGIEDFHFGEMKKNIARKKVGWPLDKKILLFLGRINTVKGIPYLLDAAEKLKEIEIKIIGWGEQEKYEKEAKLRGLNNVEFLGSFFGKAKLPYFSAADAFILPSSKEGASVTAMEALARNLPVITTDVAGMPLMIRNEKEGIVIKQKNPEDIVKAVRKIMTWKNRNVKQYSERYKWKKIVKDTVRDYKKL